MTVCDLKVSTEKNGFVTILIKLEGKKGLEKNDSEKLKLFNTYFHSINFEKIIQKQKN